MRKKNELSTIDAKENSCEKKTEKKRFTVFGVEFAYLYFLGIFVAFLGWFAENAVRLITQGVIDSRFQILPFIGVYGLIVFALHIVFGNPDDLTVFGKRVFKEKTKKTVVLSNVLALTVICLFVFLGELAVGNLWDACFGVQLWDYSKMPLSVTRYAGLIPALGYGGSAYLLFKFAYTPALKLVRGKVKYKTAVIVDSTLGVLIAADVVRLCLTIIIAGKAP
ncbi:MAG: putative ABC transporter permease, partial [Lachnospiraceae bacterium]|nr:putative ABC transporter permease [Lachnospiraceae bacterium]